MAKRGRLGVLKYDTAVVDAKDVTNDGSATEIETTSRSSGGFKTFIQGLKDMTVDFGMNWDETDAGFIKIAAAYLAGSEAAFSAFDQDGKGFSGNAIVSKFQRTEELDGVMQLSVTLKPSGPISFSL